MAQRPETRAEKLAGGRNSYLLAITIILIFIANYLGNIAAALKVIAAAAGGRL
jgi:hypothetical protein